MEAIVFTKTPWPILSDDKYWMVEEAWKRAIEAQDRQRAFAGAPAGTPSVCQLPGGPSLKIDPQTREAVSLGICLMLPYQIYNIDLCPKIYIFKIEDMYHSRTVGRWGMSNCCLEIPVGFAL